MKFTAITKGRCIALSVTVLAIVCVCIALWVNNRIRKKLDLDWKANTVQHISNVNNVGLKQKALLDAAESGAVEYFFQRSSAVVRNEATLLFGWEPEIAIVLTNALPNDLQIHFLRSHRPVRGVALAAKRVETRTLPAPRTIPISTNMLLFEE